MHSGHPSTLPDPPVKKNCAQCGKPRNAKRNPYSGDAALHDPWCSATCARAFFGVTFPKAGEKASGGEE